MRDQLRDLEKTEAERRTADQGRGSAMVARDRPAPGPHAPPDIRAPVDRAAFAARWLAEQRDAAMAGAAAWSKGRSAHYPYYTCYQRGCERRGKSVRKEKVEGAFDSLLKTLKPAPALLTIVGTLFADRWDQEGRNGRERAAAARAGIGKLEARIDTLVGRIMEAENGRVIKAYEKQIAALDDEKLRLNEIAASAGRPRSTFEESFRTAWAFLSNPWKLWESGILEHQRLVLRLAFSGPLPYCPNEGFRTAAIAEPLRFLGAFAAPGSRMVELSEESSNQIFETLADWEAQLKPFRHQFEFDQQGFDPGEPQP